MKSIEITGNMDSKRKLLMSLFWTNRKGARTEGCAPFLIEKIKTVCPQCSCPGFEIIERKKGLPCSLCNLPTHLTKSVVYQCKKCGFCQDKLFPDGTKTADPGMCQYCNP